METLPEELKDLALKWITWDKNPTTKNEIMKLIEKNDIDELKKRLLNRLEFGTAGLRGKMAAGFNYMNDLTVIEATQGLFVYLTETYCNDEDWKKRGVVIGFDGRHNSKRFAALTATVFLNKDVRVYLFDKFVPTPFIPFSTKYLNCVCGIMITASHNPKDDNGYKLYWENGAQIIPPHDQGIENAIKRNLEPWEQSWALEKTEDSPLIKNPFDDIVTAYMQALHKLCFFKKINETSQINVVYTAMHGVGYNFIQEAFKTFGHKAPIPVTQQIVPDPDFPTVTFPNPEEGKSALNLAIQTANENHCNVILANDPDADRMAIAVKKDSEWKILSGNEIGALLGWWMFFTWRKQNPEGDVKNVYMISSAVSSHILKAMAEADGFNHSETLTGFKWMGNAAYDLEKKNKTVLFAFEEAIGFMCGTTVLDKDGISACCVAKEMINYLHSHSLTITDKLNELYRLYGFHVSNNSYYLSYDKAKTDMMFEEIRHQNDSKTLQYPTKCGNYKLVRIRDLTEGTDIDLISGKCTTPTLPVSKSSNMITFYFENGAIVTVRTSGTEPKVKWYSELRTNPKEQHCSDSAAKEALDDLIQNFIKYFYQPEKFSFVPRPNQ